MLDELPLHSEEQLSSGPELLVELGVNSIFACTQYMYHDNVYRLIELRCIWAPPRQFGAVYQVLCQTVA